MVLCQSRLFIWGQLSNHLVKTNQTLHEAVSTCFKSDGPTPASFCLFLLFSNKKFTEKLYASAGFELGSSEYKEGTLTTIHHGPGSFKFIYTITNHVFLCPGANIPNQSDAKDHQGEGPIPYTKKLSKQGRTFTKLKIQFPSRCTQMVEVIFFDVRCVETKIMSALELPSKDDHFNTYPTHNVQK